MFANAVEKTIKQTKNNDSNKQNETWPTSYCCRQTFKKT